MRNIVSMERNFKNILLLLLIGAAGTAYAWKDCGTNIQYEIDGTELRFNSPDPEQPAVLATIDFIGNTTITKYTSLQRLHGANSCGLG